MLIRICMILHLSTNLPWVASKEQITFNSTLLSWFSLREGRRQEALAAIEKALALTAAVAAAPATACACSAEDVGGLLVVSAAVWLGGLWGWLLGNCVPVWYLRGLLSWVVQERTCACLLVKHPEERRGSPLPLLHVQLVKLHHYSYFALLQLVNLHQFASYTTSQFASICIITTSQLASNCIITTSQFASNCIMYNLSIFC